jgi:hypothetical protein
MTQSYLLAALAALCTTVPAAEAQAPGEIAMVQPATADSAAADSAAAGPRLSTLTVHFATAPATIAPADTGATRPKAVEYSDAYGTRLAIHRYASYAELPLFATEYVLGQKILNGERNGEPASSSTRSAHATVAGALGVLFAVNTVTGVWNMIEARHDPAGRTRRNLHALTMLLADAGFLYTASLAEGARESIDGANKHRNAAIASISVATASTLMMWLWKD